MAATKNDNHEGSVVTRERSSEVLCDCIRTAYACGKIGTENEPRKMAAVDLFRSEIVGNSFLFLEFSLTKLFEQ